MGLSTVSIFATLLAVLPLAAFYAMNHGAFDSLLGAVLGPGNVTSSSRLVSSGILGVVCVNIIVAGFLIAAWREPTPPYAKKNE